MTGVLHAPAVTTFTPGTLEHPDRENLLLKEENSLRR